MGDGAERAGPEIEEPGGRRPDDDGFSGEFPRIDLGMFSFLDKSLRIDDGGRGILPVGPRRPVVFQDQASGAIQGDAGEIDASHQKIGKP